MVQRTPSFFSDHGPFGVSIVMPMDDAPFEIGTSMPSFPKTSLIWSACGFARRKSVSLQTGVS